MREPAPLDDLKSPGAGFTWLREPRTARARERSAMPYSNNGGPWGRRRRRRQERRPRALGRRRPRRPGRPRRRARRPAAGARHRRDRPQGAGAAPDPDGRPRPRPRPGGRGRRRTGGGVGRRGLLLAGVLLVGFWLLMSFYTVRPEEQSVELTFGECRGDCIGQPGLNFAPWPIVTHEIVPVTREKHRGDRLGHRARHQRRADADRRREHRRHHASRWSGTSATRRSSCSTSPTRSRRSRRWPNWRCAAWSRAPSSAPILNRDRGVISQEVQELIQTTLDEYGSGREHRPGQLRQGRPAAGGHRRLPRGAGGAAGALDAAEPRRRLRQPDARRRARQLGAAAAGGRGLPRPGGQRRPGRGEPLHRRRAGVREGARGHPQAALPRDDGERARQRADVPDGHRRRAPARTSCPTCR